MAQEVDMLDAEASKTEVEKPIAPETVPVSSQLATMVTVIDGAVRAKEPRTPFHRVLRQLATVRKRLTPSDARAFVAGHIPEGSPVLGVLIAGVEEAERVSEENLMITEDKEEGTLSPSLPPAHALPEVEALASLLVTALLVDLKVYGAAVTLASAGLDRAYVAFNRRTLDVLAARLAQLYALASQCAGEPSGPLRARLLASHQTSSLRHDEIGQETLLNLALDSLLREGLYEQADALQARARRPEPARSAAQHARLLYYLGRIRAVKLEYSAARDALQQALRRAPLAARGFRLAATKWLVVTRLLLGDAVDRGELTAGDLAPGLGPYAAITRAVRAGDLAAFAAALAAHEARLREDRIFALVTRLRHSVIRQGLRRISAAYARISLADVAAKLGLDSAGDAESVAAKAIRDGSMDAKVEHASSALIAGSARDVYSSSEPAAAFHARIAFCMDVHNEAIRAMRYETLATLQLDDADKQRERQELELQAALEDDGMDF